LGLRDRAMLELLYSSGLRRSEIAFLQVEDLRLSGGVLVVRHGKGGKERIVPVGGVDLNTTADFIRSGAAAVGVQEELERVIPVIEALAQRVAVPISVDTSKPEVMRAAIAAGAAMVNDVRALGVPGALDAVAGTGAAVCLMHMRGEPRTMQQAPEYRDVVGEVRDFLAARVSACGAAGFATTRLCIDPGIGFGKRAEHNLALLAALDQLAAPGIPVLVGVSRKSLVGMITGRAAGDRLAGSVAMAALAVMRGAAIVRAHDVAETVDAVKIASALRRAAAGGD